MKTSASLLLSRPSTTLSPGGGETAIQEGLKRTCRFDNHAGFGTVSGMMETNFGAAGLCRTLGVLLCCVLNAAPVQALSIRAYDPARHDRFSAGYPANPVPNTNFHAAYYDFSGVGWNAADPTQSFTLISPKHIVGANHYKPGVGVTLVFQGRDGVLRNFTVAAQHNITNSAGQATDLFVGELDHAVTACDNITFYPVLDLGAEVNYVGQALTIYGKSARVGKGTLGAFQDFGGDPITGGAGINPTRAYSFAYLNATGGGDDSHVEGGDSGSPTFVATNGELFVVGVHTAVLTTGLGVNSFDTFVPSYLGQVDAILNQDGFQVATRAGQVFKLCYELIPLASSAWQVSWIGHRGRVYQLEAATNLLGGYFGPASALVTANVARVTVVDSNAIGMAKFYRIRRVD